MTNFIPLFPLNIVAFPGELLNLHIFEPRYKQLINECHHEKKAFGIATVVNNQIAEFGTTIEIISIEKIHENGELDIKTKGVQIFKILEHIKDIPEKLYRGAIVNYVETEEEGIQAKMNHILQEVKHFHELLQVTKNYNIPNENLKIFDIAHHVGLSLTQEYQLLQCTSEIQRQEYIEQHLKHTIPTIIELQNLKERIQLNGHFRKLSTDE